MPEEITRRLATIIMADVVGYSRMMGGDERGTYTRVQRLVREVIEPTIADHRGRLIKQMGDGFLAMFDSPVEAVRCAIVIQQSIVGRNIEVPSDQALRLRIGINLGDVIVEPDDIYGEGVNIAARLEQLAEPGQIFISGGVYEQVRYKLVVGYQSLGERRVKNIHEPVPTYRVLPDPVSVTKATQKRRQGWRVWLLAGLGGIAGLGVAGVAVWMIGQRSMSLLAPPSEPQSVIPMTMQTPTPTTQPQRAPERSAAIEPSAEPDRNSLPISPEAAVVPARPAPMGAPMPSVSEPQMVPIPGGSFQMGSTNDASEQPVHRVTVPAFLLSKFPVTVGQWRPCAAAKACSYTPSGDNDAPVTNVSWDDAMQ